MKGKRGDVDATHQLGGVLRYEFAMQIRRRALWIVSGLLGIIPVIQFNTVTNYTHDANLPVTRHALVVIEAAGAAGFLALGAGLLLADRLRRDRTTKVEELVWSVPAAASVRLLGKHLGSTLATLVPLALIYLIGLTCLVIRWSDPSIIPLALAGFVAFALPAVLFVAAFSIACTTVLWPPLFQFLFVGYWFWTNLNPTDQIPTLGGTYLSPTENYVYSAFFHFLGWHDGFYQPAQVWQGVLNIAVLLVCAAVALLAGWRIDGWRAQAS